MSDWKSLEYFFKPKNAAIIGASNTEGSVGFTIFKNMKLALGKNAYPVNPNHEIVQGAKAFKSIKEISDQIDLAVIVTPSKTVPNILRECVEVNVKAVIIVSAGFSETGEQELTNELKKIISENPQTRVMGPNCVGVKCFETNVDTTFFAQDRMSIPKKGSLSFISQSGALGSMILDWVSKEEFGISKFASYGNAIDIDESDLIEYLCNDKDTKVITLYLEGAKDGKKFFEVAKKTTLKKPILILKGGKYDSTSQATASHTGSMAGSAKVYEAVFRQAGIINTDGMQDLFNTAKLLEKEKLPKGKRVQIITNGGGFGIIMADHIIHRGMELAQPSRKTIEELEKELPGIKISNPLDLLGDADAQRYRIAIKKCLEDKNIDILVIMCLFTLSPLKPDDIDKMLKKRRPSKTMVVIAVGGEYTEKRLEKIEKLGYTTFDYPNTAAKSLGHACWYADYLKRKKAEK
ncbi:MAG: CoA-binding protein [Candidatus Diapherotrites archaeon]